MCCAEAAFQADLDAWNLAACVCEARYAGVVVAALDAHGIEVTALVSEHTMLVLGVDDAEWAPRPEDDALGITLGREVQVHAPCCAATPVGHCWIRRPRGAQHCAPLAATADLVRQAVACAKAWQGPSL